MRNARWNLYWNDEEPTVMTLKPGQSIELYRSAGHEEGWSCEYHRYTHEGDYLLREIEEDAVDCDGRLTRAYFDWCPLSELHSYVGWAGTLMPNWQLPWAPYAPSIQRDYEAEKAGY